MSTLKYDFPHKASARPDIALNHQRLSALLQNEGLDAVIVTLQTDLTGAPSFQQNQILALSGFDGSAGFGLFLSRTCADAIGVQQFVLFADGRYHSQAEAQCAADRVTLEKIRYTEDLWPSLIEWLSGKTDLIGIAAYDKSITTVSQQVDLLLNAFDSPVRLKAIDGGVIERQLGIAGRTMGRAIFELPRSITGVSIAENLAKLHQRIAVHLCSREIRTLFVTSVPQDLAYLLNSRGYHTEYSSSHHGILFVIEGHAYLFLPEGCDRCPVEIASYANLQVIGSDVRELQRRLSAHDIDFACYSFDTTSCAIQRVLSDILPDSRHINFSPVELMRARKTPEALNSIRDAFSRSSRAVAETMRRAKTGDDGRVTSEFDLSSAIREAYRKYGANSLSFRSIVAGGANSAIPHYCASSPEVRLADGELVLLDSGAYYDGGFATDCTRVVLRRTHAGTVAQPWQREIYTVALKAAIAGLTAKFPVGTSGRRLDELVRGECSAAGYDYAHGTGHGIGTDVHERGIWFSPTTSYEIVPDAVASIAPGIYCPGRGGVRIENVVIVRRDPGQRAIVEFENVVTVGYDWDLIDVDRLDDDERRYLTAYEAQCVAAGTQVTKCPLL
ncbi:M24 family metallopeptidase [Burkholderia cepacia]|uniref:M24 family metallopeptidase n=1 Tax=Burkholderia cepacia TaxID=292 RepID=UPI00075780EB|nr:M24 family metallopeptidase [Burkholderia cepacia]KVS62433.1 hypothetical protein WK41_32450 [Burkholderia cepacia]